MNRKLGQAFLIAAAFVFFSCKTPGKTDTYPEPSVILEPPVPQTNLPVIEFSGLGIKYEFESMLLNRFLVIQDTDASGKFAARLMDETSWAKVRILFPSGTYECLAAEKSFNPDQAAFYIYIDEEAHRVYPSNPPLGKWELTTRSPIYFTLDAPKEVLVTVQANSKDRLGETGMDLDYIQFVKRR